MSDLIDRQAAIDAPVKMVSEGIEWIPVYHLKDLPSAQPKQDREFMKLRVRNSNGRPYYSIIYLEVDDNGVGHDFEGFSSYSLDVISEYLKKYFMPSAQPDMSEYSSKLWRNAYERGKRDAQQEPSQVARDIATIIENEQDMRVVLKNAQNDIIRCKDCKYYDPNDHCYLQGAEADDFCSYAERRTDE